MTFLLYSKERLLPLSIEEVQLVERMTIQVLKRSEGCPSHGRGDQRVRSCGLVRKWDNAGRQVERFEVLGTCIMGGVSTVITAENSTTSGREYTEATMACQ